ncbi:MAG: sulfhydrogenase subunit delta [endosymbiont of Galathealinum brachiosum]|uniref:Sulfhydrogenase subunit delta n=1 Tax=endosymbiont of Galathealinum brachiosum TaxID=2200906 RepID=A0A370DM34_9GAMM|nr:MAG: sulfhydrogenase subunit delta [endosymbiont of Galathealinum brachiosum]
MSKQETTKPSVAVHKFSSCDGCQLALINMGEPLLVLTQLVDIKHFAEAGPLDENAIVDIAIIEGSVSTSKDLARLQKIRDNSTYIMTIGACATSGGLQALRNMANTKEWIADIYANPSVIDSLDNSTPIKEHVKVDLELWGCPVNEQQILSAIRALLFGVLPKEENDKVCMECKRQQSVCVMVTKNEACMGPVTRTGCGALCPSVGRDCYGCYGPSENPNTNALANRLLGFGLVKEEVARRFLFINSAAKQFQQQGIRLKN